jgi:protein SCO1
MNKTLALLLALLGGCAHGGITAPDFTLTDQHGQPWSLAAQRGKVVALFFGYTHCADTCPATLAKLAAAVDSQGNASHGAEIAFVTIDPQRDSPAALARYITRFGGAPIVGLTGRPAQVAAVEKAYHVWSQRIPGRHGSDEYDDSHTAIVFLIDRSGTITAMHDDSDTVSSIAGDVRKALE